ncbi:radical SAM family heme chaperone HemW [Hyphococcus sp. DH-69]|uniref:radical SAM family heme chaperone HemW n=1 Tax=Hyphococcus formosus TaxID=3143534 RepID=UPI00398B3A76
MNTKPFGVYLHWPYCARICPYCDFNVYKNRTNDEAAWIAALTQDLDFWANRTAGQKLSSLYFGGGTPSLAPLSVIEAVITHCDQKWGFTDDAEITLEANPTDAERATFADHAKAGINRLSLGVQSLRDDALKFLGREHDAEGALRAIETANDVFNRITFDLIYARPNQTLADWEKELGEALALGSSHLSLYQLTIEPGTAFAKAVDSGRWQPAPEDLCADMFDLAQAQAAAAHMPAYEISNHAAPGNESRHNMIYWTNADYIGIGPGAHGRITENGIRMATETALKPSDYLANPSATETPLTQDEAMTERFSMGLRLIGGMPLTPDDMFFDQANRLDTLKQLIEDGMLEWDQQNVRATADGRRLLNRVLYALLG